MDASLPDHPWTLSAPESLVLLCGPEVGDTRVLSLAILELAVRHDLIFANVTSKRFLWTTHESLVLLGTIVAATGDRAALDAVRRALLGPRMHPVGTQGTSIEDIARVLMPVKKVGIERIFGKQSMAPKDTSYVRLHVMPTLENLGIYARRWGVGSSLAEWDLTPQGTEILANLRSLLTTGREQFKSLAYANPSLARAYIEQVGSASLLVRGLAASCRRLVTGYSAIGPSPFRNRHAATHPSLPHTRKASDSSSPVLTPESLARDFGPLPGDDLDMALHSVTTALEQYWASAYRGRLGVGGEYSVGGE